MAIAIPPSIYYKIVKKLYTVQNYGLFQIFSRITFFISNYISRRTLRHDLAAALAAFRSQVNYLPISPAKSRILDFVCGKAADKIGTISAC
ncbi:MAG: hypothetical protein AUJ39_02170 [Parcubacteria group bacterium CG1_02_42_13]|nr:MAG: hypothetical protein AUJ39_02170 [Parcubacteria group bacterium CG1_02_42_13]